MLTALRGLTLRGRCFLAAGLTVAACALVLGERDLLRIGLLLLALPLVAVAVVTRTRYRLACTRHVDPARVQAGREAQVGLRLDNISRLPSGMLLMEDTLPWVLGGQPRFVLDRVEPRGVRDVAYPLRSDVRGRFRIGPLTVRLTDPFGMCELGRAFAAVDTLVVTPVVTPLPAVRLGGELAGGGDSTARSMATSGDDDAATREYRQGDDLRKVHWRSTARTGELMVRREEQPRQSRVTVLLDSRARAHSGEGAASSLEWAISAAASISVHLVRSGYSLQLITDGGAELAAPGASLADGLVLDPLAILTASAEQTLAPGLDAARSGGAEGLVVAVLGWVDVAEAEALARLRTGGTTGIAVCLDTARWGAATARRSSPSTGRSSASGQDASPFEAAADVLFRAGWRVLRAGPETSLAALWPLAGARAAGAGARAAGAGAPASVAGAPALTRPTDATRRPAPVGAK